MDIGALRTKLTALGVTSSYDDDPPGLAPAQLQSDRQYRASLYIQYLEPTQLFLTSTLADHYPFCAQALGDPGLLDQLAKSLDQWVCPAVQKALQLAMSPPNPVTTYADWFNTNVFDPNDDTYEAKRDAFFTSYPTTANALTQIAAHFRDNLAEACDRIVTDRADIVTLFSDRYPGLTLTALTKIASTGSDFHKGGRQVLVLTFQTLSFGGRLGSWWPVSSTLRLIYKPADLEVDCLIAGDSAAVNRVMANFFPANTKSLVEIFNDFVSANSAPGRESLPTYRILPRERTSVLAPPGVGAPLPIRDAYGYIEFLDYSFTGDPYSIFNYFPLGASDYVIFRSQAAAPIIAKFYRQLGHLLALAVTFSLQDLHVENVRVTSYEPRLIDLEVSLTSQTENVTDTLLFFWHGGPKGGINGEDRDDEDFLWSVPQPLTRPIGFDRKNLTKYYQNRLWWYRPTRQLVPIDQNYLLDGLQKGMDVLRALAAANGFTSWFARLANVLVRVLPVTTGEWIAVRQSIYDSALNATPPPVQLDPTVATRMVYKLTEKFEQYQTNPTPEPDFVGVFAPQAAIDLTNFDIPVFYHRIGSLDLLDSAGNIVAVPPQVTVYDNNDNEVQRNTNVDRTTFFAAPPTATRIQNGQVAALAGPGFAETSTRWRAQCVVEMGRAAVPVNPGILI